jgi:hypothetical protein
VGGRYEVRVMAVDSVELAETDEAYVGVIESEGAFASGAGGRLAVADRLASRVVVYARDGSFMTTLGRKGDGPGEFRTVWAVAWDSEGRLWVSDNRRITVFDRGFALDTTFRAIPEIEYARRLKPVEGGMLMEEYRWPVSGTVVRRYDLQGEPGPAIFDVPPRDGDPYVLGEFRASLHVAGDTVLTASSVSYPLHMYDLEGNPLATFGTRPPSIGTVT